MHQDSSGIKATQSLFMKRKNPLGQSLGDTKGQIPVMPPPDCKFVRDRFLSNFRLLGTEFLLDKRDGSDGSRYRLIVAKERKVNRIRSRAGSHASSLDANRVPRPFSPAHQAFSPTKAYLPTVPPPYKITTINFDIQRSRVTRFLKVMIMFE